MNKDEKVLAHPVNQNPGMEEIGHRWAAIIPPVIVVRDIALPHDRVPHPRLDAVMMTAHTGRKDTVQNPIELVLEAGARFVAPGAIPENVIEQARRLRGITMIRDITMNPTDDINPPMTKAKGLAALVLEGVLRNVPVLSPLHIFMETLHKPVNLTKIGRPD